MSKKLGLNSPIVFDLDGVLLDVSERYFRVHSDIMETFGGRPMDKAIYWNLKRDRQPVRTLLSISGNSHVSEEAYRAQWLQKIELPEYLQYDSVIPGARKQLESLQKCRSLILITLRQRRDYLEVQLKQLHLRRFFAAVLSAGPTEDNGWETKRRLICQSGFLTKDALVVGDTEIDIRAGKSLALTTVAMLSGIRNREHLEKEHPDIILEDIRALPQVVDDNCENRNVKPLRQMPRVSHAQ